VPDRDSATELIMYQPAAPFESPPRTTRPSYRRSFLADAPDSLAYDVTLTIDHRVLDGFRANAFLARWVEKIEGWG
jgi:pyruvate/2-oxoglutarate dehydrogenase complex dihydrolipoamide acyltransferase (E2) component